MPAKLPYYGFLGALFDESLAVSIVSIILSSLVGSGLPKSHLQFVYKLLEKCLGIHLRTAKIIH